MEVRHCSKSASSDQCSVAYQVAGAKLGQAGPFAGTDAPRSVQRPLLKCAQFMCIARPCMEN
jgi:hypothetical protein